MEKQPAKVNYFFHDGYVEFGDTLAVTFQRCGKVIRDSWESTTEHFVKMWRAVVNFVSLHSPFSNFFKSIGFAFVFGLALGRLILSAILTPVLCIIISAVQAIVLLLFMLGFYLIYLLVLFADWIYRSIKKISTSCPQCQMKYSLPSFVCTCGAEHTKLSPSKYGAFSRRCTCGRKLKTTFFNGRHKQKGTWVCPACGYELGGPLQVDIPIPVVGGPSAGKTCYINMAISQLEENAESHYGLDFEYRPNDALGDNYEENKALMGSGRLPEKTNDTRLRYYQFYLTPKGTKVKNLISLCDVAGEAYDSNDEIGKQIGYKFANAFLLVVDPLSIGKFREEVEGSIDTTQYGASNRDMDEVLNVLINTLENMNCLTSKNMIKTDVAVVFAKSDIPGLADHIGEEVVKAYMESHPKTNKYDAMNAVCEKFLIDYEEDNFLNSLKSKFQSIQFFSCSALGHVENGDEFQPVGVEEPALWLIDKASVSIDLKKIWGKKI